MRRGWGFFFAKNFNISDFIILCKKKYRKKYIYLVYEGDGIDELFIHSVLFGGLDHGLEAPNALNNLGYKKYWDKCLDAMEVICFLKVFKY